MNGARRPWLPPRWFIHLAWRVHRGIYRISGGRRGLARAKPGKEGYFRLTTTGRRSGRPRAVILAYFEDGPNIVTLAMNGWDEGEPAWWLNLLAQPDATVELKGEGTRAVRGRAAVGDKRTRLWSRYAELGGWGGSGIDAYAALRSTETAVVVLEPRADAAAL